MMCSPFDLKDYFFGELERRTAGVGRAASWTTCAACREELAALSATRSAVLCMREEELPRRIAFVSDKVFEPRWWQKFLASGPQLGFRIGGDARGGDRVPRDACARPRSRARPAVAQVESQGRSKRRSQPPSAGRVEKVVLENQSRETDRLLEIVNSRLSAERTPA